MKNAVVQARQVSVVLVNQRRMRMINLNMLFSAIQNLPKPDREGEKLSVDVNDYLCFFNFKHKCRSSKNNQPAINSFTSITLIAVQYKYGDEIDLQWELYL